MLSGEGTQVERTGDSEPPLSLALALAGLEVDYSVFLGCKFRNRPREDRCLTQPSVIHSERLVLFVSDIPLLVRALILKSVSDFLATRGEG